MKAFKILTLIVAITAGHFVMAQSDSERKLSTMAEENIVQFKTKSSLVADVKASLDKKQLEMLVSPVEGTKLKMKDPLPVMLNVKNANTQTADFDNAKGVVVIEGTIKEGNSEFHFKGNLSLVTLKGIGNLNLVTATE